MLRPYSERVLKDTPAEAVLKDTPAEAALKDTPAEAVLNNRRCLPLTKRVTHHTHVYSCLNV